MTKIDVTEILTRNGSGSDLDQHQQPQQLRVFDEKLVDVDPAQKRAFETYSLMHSRQTVDFVKAKIKQYGELNHGEMGIMEALQHLSNFYDQSDPDVHVPNLIHAYQTAERIREAHPDKEWFQFVGLIHDLGKVLEIYGEPHWCVAGDTFVVGCKPPKSVVYHDTTFGNNPDMQDSRYNTELGMYERNCGLSNLLMSWGHDEYLYQVLLHYDKCELPPEALYMIRFHSFYPYHTGGDYRQFMNEYDKKMLPLLLELNKYDLYSKTDSMPDVNALQSYYAQLAEKFCPGKVKW